MLVNTHTHKRIQEYLRRASAPFRELIQVGPFLATFTEGLDNPYVNYAIPDDDAGPSREEIEALCSAYISRNRSPRFEYISSLAPAVAPALIADGFIEERRTPLMICPPGQQGPVTLPDGFELVFPNSDEDLFGLISALYEAYDNPPPVRDEIERHREFIEKGGICVLARDIADREAAGGGSCTVPIDGVTEVAGIGVRSRFRRRGLAHAITAFLAKEAFDRGVTLAFLMAASEAEARIYSRAGFQQIGEVLHISKPK